MNLWLRHKSWSGPEWKRCINKQPSTYMPAHMKLDCLNWMKMGLMSSRRLDLHNGYPLAQRVDCLGTRNRKFIPDHPKSIKGTLGNKNCIYIFQDTNNFKWTTIDECLLVVWLYMCSKISHGWGKSLLPGIFSWAIRQIKGYKKTWGQVANLARHLFYCGTKAPILILECELHRQSMSMTPGTTNPRWPHPKYQKSYSHVH